MKYCLLVALLLTTRLAHAAPLTALGYAPLEALVPLVVGFAVVSLLLVIRMRLRRPRP